MTAIDGDRVMAIAQPDSTRSLPHVGTYRRELPVALERLYENALDWEHLPWLHSSTFASVECIDVGPWGWRAGVEYTRSSIQPAVLELMLDRDSRRWITRTLSGPAVGNEVWTHAFAEGQRRTDIVVDFFVPGLPPDRRSAVGESYCRLYAQLYDEDVSMMTGRQDRLDERAGARPAKTESPPDLGPLDLGPLASLRVRLPIVVTVADREYRVVEVDGELHAHATVCPHRLGPLGAVDVRVGVIECPWHGYRFDVRTGANLDGHGCRLSPAPKVRVDPDTTVVTIG